MPNSTTSATAAATFSSVARTAPWTPATAAAPQIEKPPAINMRRSRSTPKSFPIPSVAKKVTPTAQATITRTPGPSARIAGRESWSPNRTTPHRRTRFADTAIPGSRAAGTGATFRQRAPNTTAISMGLRPETALPARIDAAPMRAQITSPGSIRRRSGVVFRSLGRTR